jgi:hypothetical protein
MSVLLVEVDALGEHARSNRERVGREVGGPDGGRMAVPPPTSVVRGVDCC